MEKWQLDHIEKNPQLLEVLKVSPKLVNGLKKHKILNGEEVEIIFSKVTSYEKADELLRCLKIRDSYYILVAELKADGTLNEAAKILMNHSQYKPPDDPNNKPTDVPLYKPPEGSQCNLPDDHQLNITGRAHCNRTGDPQFNPAGVAHFNPAGGAQFNPAGGAQFNPASGAQFNPVVGVQYNLSSGPQYYYPGGPQYNYPVGPHYNYPGGPQYYSSGGMPYYPLAGAQYNPSGSIQYYPPYGPQNYPNGGTQSNPLVVLPDNKPGDIEDSAISGLIVGDPGCTINEIVVSLYNTGAEHKLAENWMKLAKPLDISKSFELNLERKVRMDRIGGIEILDDLLHEWRSRKSKDATLAKLLTALNTAAMKDIADTIRVHFKARK